MAINSKQRQRNILGKIRVLDLSRILAGPFCTQILSDQGAEVIKLESPDGDETRRWGPPFCNRKSAYFAGVNRNKKSIVLDLREKISLKVLHQLLSKSDVLIENFKFGDLKKFGISERVLKSKYPRLIHCQISGFGASSEFRSFPGYDAAIQAWSGLMSINGSVEATKVGVPIVDLVTGQNCAFAILAALFEREFSGRGQKIETSLIENAFSILHPQASNYFFSKKAPARLGNTHPNIAPYDMFQTKKLGIYIACGNDRQFQILCRTIKAKNLGEDLRFQSNELRLKNRVALQKNLQKFIGQYEARPLALRLLKSGVPAGPALELPEALRQKQVLSLGVVQKGKDESFIMPPFQFSRYKRKKMTSSPELGAHSLSILETLDLSSLEVEKILLQQRR